MLYHLLWHHVRWYFTGVILNKVSCGTNYKLAANIHPFHLWVQSRAVSLSFLQVGGAIWLSPLPWAEGTCAPPRKAQKNLPQLPLYSLPIMQAGCKRWCSPSNGNSQPGVHEAPRICGYHLGSLWIRWGKPLTFSFYWLLCETLLFHSLLM